MGGRLWLRVVGLPLLVLALQGGAGWFYVRTAKAAWGLAGTLGGAVARETTLWQFAACGPLAGLLLGWGLYATYARLRLPAALVTTALYLVPLLISGLSTWVLGVCMGWF